MAVFMVTYDHEAYIEQALDGILAQKTNFPVKIFLGEDHSSDRTREICLSYKEKYSDRIELLLNERNLGAIKNAQNVYSACFEYGDYIAMCEGDDYWTDPSKLQKQVEFLEANPDYTICFHRVQIRNEDDLKRSDLSNHDQSGVMTFEDLALGNCIHTPSVVFRTGLFAGLPHWFWDTRVGDYPLHLLNAEHGKIKFMPEVMAVYRVHKRGMWGWQDREMSGREMIKIVETCRSHFAPRGAKEFGKQLADQDLAICFFMFENGKYEEFRRAYSDRIGYAWTTNKRAAISLSIKALVSRSATLGAAYRFLLFRWRGRSWDVD